MRALVTGAGGFLGGAITRLLLEGGQSVRGYQRGSYPGIARLGVEMVEGDLLDSGKLASACRGVDVLFHVAAKAGVWGRYADYFNANVLGTRNVIAVARQLGIGRIVFTSSPSVVFAGSDENGVDEREAYPTRYLAHYPQTKALAEREMLAAHGKDLQTVALRPHLIWGPGDRNLVPRIVSRAKAGKLRLVGDGSKLVDSTYIDNAAAAHLLAADRLGTDGTCGGKAYFISNGEPLAMRDLLRRILRAAGLPEEIRQVPVGIAKIAAWLMELKGTLLQSDQEPALTRFVAAQLSTAHWFSLAAARRDLGYEPEIKLEEGFSRLEQWISSGGLQ